jgi:hypothetical protein
MSGRVLHGMHKDVAQVLRKASRQGVTHTMTAGKHVQVRTASGQITHISLSPHSGSRAAKALKAWLKRQGIHDI